MANNNETVRGVCDLLDSMTYTNELHCTDKDRFLIRSIVAKTLSAYEREISAKDAEIARLKAALKPVMNVNLDGLHEYDDIDFSNLLSSIIADAQRVMLEGGDK